MIKKQYSKKIISFLLIVIVIGSFSGEIYADDEIEEENEQEVQEQVLEVAGKVTDEPVTTARRAIVYERNSKTVLYQKEAEKRTAMASTTKIMTALVVIENCENLQEVVTITSKAANTGGSRLGLKKNDKITVNDLLYGLMLRSRK